MAFFDVKAYADHMRMQNMLRNGLTTGLVFEPHGTSIACLSTSGQLSIQKLPSRTEKVSPTGSAIIPGNTRTLEAGKTALFAGSSTGLYMCDWGATLHGCLLEEAVLATASLNSGHLAVALQRGSVALFDEQVGHSVDVLAAEAKINCLAALPGAQSQFVAVSSPLVSYSRS